MSDVPTLGEIFAVCKATYDQGLIVCQDQRYGEGQYAYVCSLEQYGTGFEGYGWQCPLGSYCPDATLGGIDQLDRGTGCCQDISLRWCPNNSNCIYTENSCCGTSDTGCTSDQTCMTDSSCCNTLCGGNCIDGTGATCCGDNACASGTTCMTDGSCCTTLCNNACIDGTGATCCGSNTCASGTTCMTDGSCCTTLCNNACIDGTGKTCCGSNTCDSGTTCMNDGSCCSTLCNGSCLDGTGSTCCGTNTCSSDQTCMSNGSCCGNTCGSSCLDGSDQTCCGGTTCDDDEQCVSNTCTSTPQAPSPTPTEESSPTSTTAPNNPGTTTDSDSSTDTTSPTSTKDGSSSSTTSTHGGSKTSTSTKSTKSTSTSLPPTIPLSAQTDPTAPCFLYTQYTSYYTTPDWYRSLPASSQSMYSATHSSMSQNATCTSTTVIITHPDKGLSTGAKAGIAVGALIVAALIIGGLILRWLKPHFFSLSNIFGHHGASLGEVAGPASGTGAAEMSEQGMLYSQNPTAANGGQSQFGNHYAPTSDPASVNPYNIASSGAAYTSASELGALGVLGASAAVANHKPHHHKRPRKNVGPAHHHHLFYGHPCSSFTCPLLASDHVCKDPNVEPVGPCTCMDKKCELNNKDHECSDDVNACFCEEEECPDVKRATRQRSVTLGTYFAKNGIKEAVNNFN